MKKFLFLLIIIATAASFSFTAIDDEVKASISDTFVITLPDDQPLADVYIADISAIYFDDRAQAAELFSMISESIVEYEVIYEQKFLKIMMNKSEITEDWGIEQWNDYFEIRANKMQAVYNMLREKE